MRKILLAPIAFVFAYLLYGILISTYEFRPISKSLTPRKPDSFYDYAGVINVHTTESTGSGSIEEVIEAAQNAELDFIIFTDLSSGDVNKGFEGYNDKLLVFIGAEYSYLDSRLLNFDSTESENWGGRGRSQMVLAELFSRETTEPEHGVFILAHPLKPGFRWTGEYPKGLRAIEVFNLKSIWQWAWFNDRGTFLTSLLLYPFNPTVAFVRIFSGSSRAELTLWDQLNRERHVVGYAGSDAESRVRMLGRPYAIPSYEMLFSIMRNHVLLRSELTGSPAADKRKVADALRAGQFYMSLDLLADPRGFSAYVKGPDGVLFPIGSNIKMRKGLEYVVQLPEKPEVPFEVILFKDGERITTSTSLHMVHTIHSPGVYRTMVRLKITLPPPLGRIWTPWIFTNPIRVQEDP